MSAAEMAPDDYLVKPFTEETLRLRLTRATLQSPELDFAKMDYKPFEPASTEELVEFFDKNVAEAIEVLRELFGVEHVTRVACGFVVSSKQLGLWFESLGFAGHADTKRLPAWVFDLPHDQRAALVLALMDRETLDKEEVAEIFRVNPKTVTRWANAGKISSIRTLGGHRRFRRSEVEFSAYNFEHADTAELFHRFDACEREALKLVELGLPLPAYDQVCKASHSFNLLDARRAISVTERQRYILRVRNLSRSVADGSELGWLS